MTNCRQVAHNCLAAFWQHLPKQKKGSVWSGLNELAFLMGTFTSPWRHSAHMWDWSQFVYFSYWLLMWCKSLTYWPPFCHQTTSNIATELHQLLVFFAAPLPLIDMSSMSWAIGYHNECTAFGFNVYFKGMDCLQFIFWKRSLVDIFKNLFSIYSFQLHE